MYVCKYVQHFQLTKKLAQIHSDTLLFPYVTSLPNIYNYIRSYLICDLLSLVLGFLFLFPLNTPAPQPTKPEKKIS